MMVGIGSNRSQARVEASALGSGSTATAHNDTSVMTGHDEAGEMDGHGERGEDEGRDLDRTWA